MERTQEEQVQADYDAAMDSVDLINAGKPKEMDDAEWQDCAARNKAHLEIQLAKPEYYEGYDLAPMKDAVNAKV